MTGKSSSSRGVMSYFKMYPRDFIEGTIGMPLELKGGYLILLNLIYANGGRLVDDPHFISGVLGCSVRKWKSLRAELISRGKIDVENEMISNFRADLELESWREVRDKNAENRSRPNKINDLESPNHQNKEAEAEAEADISLSSLRSERDARARDPALDFSEPDFPEPEPLEVVEADPPDPVEAKPPDQSPPSKPEPPPDPPTARDRQRAIEAEFDETFWPAWPHKVGKPPARRAFAKARKAETLDRIMAGVERYIRDKPPDRPWLNPATFLNQERWADEPAKTLIRMNGNGDYDRKRNSTFSEAARKRLDELPGEFDRSRNSFFEAENLDAGAVLLERKRAPKVIEGCVVQRR